MKTLYSHAGAAVALAYNTYTTGANAGTAVDLTAFKNDFRDVLFVITAGASGDSGTHTFTVTEADSSGGQYSVVDSSRCQGLPLVVNTDNDNAVHLVGCRPTKQFVKLVDTAASASSGCVLSAVALLGSGSSNPPARS